MINLIPKEEKKKLISNFHNKLIVLFLVILSFSFLIALVAILPAYFLSSAKKNIVQSKLEVQQSEPLPVPDQETLMVIKNLNNKLDLVEHTESNKFLVSQKVIKEIILKKRSDVKITDIYYENDPVKGRKISIRGGAPSREVLLLFRQALESDTVFFKQVDLPISNFVKGSNIQFYLSLTPA